ncbi:hypothetical protein [Burkholderia sp. S-53]|uniref:hypothetical protein n=1 Tax=Burkholderia sp. S-53 TaxID=2906514 RepID=UPI0021CFF360|nr:hypothetical protein [Burkholderia sp. S-53]UXU85646.1 hypothetical protein LXM88_04585 [Burkholderia sp. S-53]
MKKPFRNAWRGEERLWKVWWLIGVPLNLLFIPLLVLIMGPAYPAPLRLAAFVIYIVPFCAWVRCARRTSRSASGRSLHAPSPSIASVRSGMSCSI